MKRSWRNILASVVSFILVSCGSSSNVSSDDFPGLVLPVSEMNTTIQIEELSEFGNSHTNGEFLTLHVINLSDETIVFHPDSFSMLFVRTGEDWLPIANNMHYSSEITSLYPTDDFPPGLVFTFSPFVSDMTEEQSIRIFVIGHYDGNDDKLVGAYVDVVLNP